MSRVRAVDHVVSRRAVRQGVDGFDRFTQRLVGRNPTVGFGRKGYDGRDICGLCGERDTRSLADMRHGHRRDQVCASFVESMNLIAMIGCCFVPGHGGPGFVAVAARTDITADHQFRVDSFMPVAQRCHEADRIPVHLHETRTIIAKPRRPIGAGPPGCCLHDEAEPVVQGNPDVAFRIAGQFFPAGIGFQQRKRGEFRNF